MSILSKFISTQLISAIENEFIHHAPEIQAVIISEIKHFLAEGYAWVEKKLATSPQLIGENNEKRS